MKVLFGLIVSLVLSTPTYSYEREREEWDPEKQAGRVQFNIKKGEGLNFHQVVELDRITGLPGLANIINELSENGTMKGECKATTCTVEYETETSGSGGASANGGLIGGKVDADAKKREKFKVTGPCHEVIKILEKIREKEEQG